MVAMAFVSGTAASRSMWSAAELSKAGSRVDSVAGLAAVATRKLLLRDLQDLVALAAAAALVVAAMASVGALEVVGVVAASEAVIADSEGVVEALVVVVTAGSDSKTALERRPTRLQVPASAVVVMEVTVATGTAMVVVEVGMIVVAAHMTTDQAETAVVTAADSETAIDEVEAAAQAPMLTTSLCVVIDNIAILTETTAGNAATRAAAMKIHENCDATDQDQVLMVGISCSTLR